MCSINFYVCLKLLHFSIIFHMENSRCLFVLLLFVPCLRKLTLCITLCLKVQSKIDTKLLTLDTKIWQSPLFGSHDRLQMLMQKLGKKQHLLNEQVNKNSIALIYSRRMDGEHGTYLSCVYISITLHCAAERSEKNHKTARKKLRNWTLQTFFKGHSDHG